MTVTIESRIWVEKDGKPFLGKGRISLLEAIDRSGSISKAALSLNMSYKKAWGLVKSMNILSDKSLVIKETGGKNGGGTKLTEEGKSLIRRFRELEENNSSFLKERMTESCFE